MIILLEGRKEDIDILYCELGMGDMNKLERTRRVSKTHVTKIVKSIEDLLKEAEKDISVKSTVTAVALKNSYVEKMKGIKELDEKIANLIIADR